MMDNLEDVKYAVMDDMNIKFFPQYKNWLGAQKEFQVKRLYRDPEMVMWGRPCIWINNEDPRDHVTAPEREWLEGNCIFYEVTSSLFRPIDG